MPHITEEVWRTLTQTGEDQCLALQSYPTANLALINPELEKQFDLLIGTIRTIRNLRAEAGVKPSVKIEAILQSDNSEELGILKATQDYIQDLAKVKTLTIADGEGKKQADRASSKATVTPLATPVIKNGEATKAMVGLSLMSARVKGALSRTGSSLRAFLENPLEFLNQLSSQLQKPAIALGLLLGIVFVLRLTTVLLDTLNDIPLLPSVLKLVGLGYTVWFLINYLPKADRRQTLSADIQRLWQTFTGPKGSIPNAQPLNLSKSQKTNASPSASLESPLANVSQSVATESLGSAETNASQSQMFAGVVGTVQVLIPLTGVVDVNALKAKLQKDLGKVEGEMKSLSDRLSNSSFVDKAPAEVVQGARDSLAEAEKQAEILRHRLELL